MTAISMPAGLMQRVSLMVRLNEIKASRIAFLTAIKERVRRTDENI